MDHEHRFTGRRARTALGLVVVAAALAVTAAIAGIGFAGNSMTAAQYQYGKVTICHHTKSKTNPTRTITVSARAWPAHQRHGDTLGACAPATAPKAGKGKALGKAKHQTTTTTTTSATTTAPSPGNGNGHGKGKGK